MLINENYEHDINYAFELSRFVCRLLGIWPYARTKFRFLETLKRALLILISFILLICELIPATLYMVIVQRETRARLKVAATVISAAIAIVKYGQLLFNRNQVKNCLIQVKDDWRNVTNPSDRDIMINNVKTSRHLLIICIIFMYTMSLSYRTIIPLSRKKIVTKQNFTIRHLPCPTYFVLFDVQLSPAYEIVFFMQVLSGLIKFTITTALCGIAGLFVMHICAQLEILMTLMNNLINERELKNVNEKLAVIIKHQIKTRNLLQLMQNAIQYTNLLEVMGCTILLCLMEYFVIMEWEDNNTVALCSYFVAVTSFGISIFIFCFFGEQLSTKGEEVALTACTLEWYRLPDAKARALILIMVMSNSPIRLRAGKFIDLSFKTYGNVVKTAVTYLNILRSIAG